MNTIDKVIEVVFGVTPEPEPQNLSIMTQEVHDAVQEAIHESHSARSIEFVSHMVWDFNWKPGKPLRRSVGGSVRLEVSLRNRTGFLPHRPRSRMGKLIREEKNMALASDTLARKWGAKKN